MSNVLKKITARAKQIRKIHPSTSWKAAIKKASAEYRSKARPVHRKKAGRKKKAHAHRRLKFGGTKRKRALKRGSVVRVKHVLAGIGATRAAYKKSLKEKILNAAGRKELAIKVNQRKKISREIAKLKKDYRAVC